MDTLVPENICAKNTISDALQKRNQRAKGMRKEKTEAKRKHSIMNSITKFSSLIYNPSFLSSLFTPFSYPAFTLSILLLHYLQNFSSAFTLGIFFCSRISGLLTVRRIFLPSTSIPKNSLFYFSVFLLLDFLINYFQILEFTKQTNIFLEKFLL